MSLIVLLAYLVAYRPCKQMKSERQKLLDGALYDPLARRSRRGAFAAGNPCRVIRDAATKSDRS